jgi:hypothetical protein
VVLALDSSCKTAFLEETMSIREDRRKYKRFKVIGNVLTCCRLHAPKVAEVIDVSKAGMAFTYVGREGVSDDIIQLDIVFPDGTDYVSKVPCETVSDADMGTGKRRSGAKFVALTEEQSAKLDFFIQNYCSRDDKV